MVLSSKLMGQYYNHMEQITIIRVMLFLTPVMLFIEESYSVELRAYCLRKNFRLQLEEYNINLIFSKCKEMKELRKAAHECVKKNISKCRMEKKNKRHSSILEICILVHPL